MKTKFLTQSATIATVYIILTWIFAPISFGHNLFQFRISEVMTILPIFTPAAIPGLFVGCFLSNLIFGGLGIIDLVLGSLATLIAGFLSYKLRNKPRIVAIFPPVIVNALIVGSYLNYLISPEISVFVNIGWVFLGQVVSCYLLGMPLCKIIDKYASKYIK